MPDRTVTSNGHHIPDGTHRDDDGWRPILCGGGITDPGPDITIPDPDVCPDCLDALADDTHPLTPLADRMAVTYQGEPDTGWARRLHRRGMRDVLTLLEREGWGPCASRCRHHNGMCSDIVDANEAMGEALTTARADLAACLKILDNLLAPGRWETSIIRPVPWNERTVEAAMGISEAAELQRWTAVVLEITDRYPGALDD